MVESARAVCVAWKEVLRGRDEDSKEKCMEAYKEEKKKIKSCMCQSKKEVNEQFRRKMNEDLIKNRKQFWKEESRADEKKEERWREEMGGQHRGE